MDDLLRTLASTVESPLTHTAALLEEGVALSFLRYDLDPALRMAALDRTAHGLLELVRLSLLREHLDNLTLWLPYEVLQVMAVTGRLDDALAYAQMAANHGGPLRPSMAIACALHDFGHNEEAERVTDGLLDTYAGSKWLWQELVYLLARVGRESEARDLAGKLLDRLDKTAAPWGVWSEAAKELAEAGLSDLALEAARRAVEDFTTAGSVGAEEGLGSGRDLCELARDLEGLLGEVAGLDGLERLSEGVVLAGSGSRITEVFSRVAGELFQLGKPKRASGMLDLAQSQLVGGSLLEWFMEGAITPFVKSAARLNDRERLLSFRDFVSAHPAYPDGVTGACLVDLSEGLLAAGPADVALETLRDGARAIAADDYFIDFLTGETLVKAAKLMMDTQLPGALGEALGMARAAPLRDFGHMCHRNNALGSIAWLLLDAGREEEAATVASEALRVTWEYVSVVPERALLRDASRALHDMGAREQAAELAERALAATTERQNRWTELLDCAELQRLAGNEGAASALVTELLAAVDTAREKHGRDWGWPRGLAELCRPLCALGEEEVADRLAWEALEATIALATEGHRGLSCSQLFGAFEVVDDLLGQDAVVTNAQRLEGEARGDVWREASELLVARLAVRAAECGDGAEFDAIAARLGGLDEDSFRSGDIAVTLARGLLALDRRLEAVDLLCRSRAAFHPGHRARDPVWLAETLISADMLEEALSLATEALPSGSLAAVAVVLAGAGQREAAERALRRAFVTVESDSEIFAVLAKMFEALARWEEADTIVTLVDAVLEVAALRPADQRGGFC